MTLNTRAYLSGNIDGETAFDLALRAILTAARRMDDYDTVQVERGPEGHVPGGIAVRRDDETDADYETRLAFWRSRPATINTAIGQGLPAITYCYHRGDAPVAAEDEYDDGYLYQPACQVEVSWDTAYGYNAYGMGCGALHAAALTLMHESLPAGVTMRWENEFTGEVHDGIDNVIDLVGEGEEVATWFRNVALPAVIADAAARSMETEPTR